MQTRRFHCPDLTQDAVEVALPVQESMQAAKVLRLRQGDKLTLMNGRGLIADAELVGEVTPRECRCRILSLREAHRPAPAIWLYVAPPHNRAFDAILSAAVELGVSQIFPVITRYSVSRPEGKSSGWDATLVAAMKQSMNPWLPEIASPAAFAEALAGSPAFGFFGATPHHGLESARAATALREQEIVPVALWIGPEGGFSQEEETELLRHGLTPLSVGSYVLRVETAVPAALAAILTILEKQGRSPFPR